MNIAIWNFYSFGFRVEFFKLEFIPVPIGNHVACNFSVDPGILFDSIDVLQKAKELSKDKNYNLVSLSFDEMRVKKKCSYNARRDCFEGNKLIPGAP